MCMVIKTMSAFQVEELQRALPFCSLDFGSEAAQQPLTQDILRL